MAWLTSLLKKPETIEEEQSPTEAEGLGTKDGAEDQPPAPDGPQLAILAPDLAGISSFRLSLFPDAASAVRDIEQFPPEMRRATHAFWAVHDEPSLPESGHKEAIVLIRANLTSDVVYAVSFVDMKSAWSFARFEVKRGLPMSHLVIVWAAFASIREELNGVSVLPSTPPATKSQPAATIAPPSPVEQEADEAAREHPRREDPIEAPSVTDSVAAPEAPTGPAPDADAEAERRAEAARVEAARVEAEEATRIARQAQEELRAARAAADAARAQAEAEATRRAEAERRLEEAREAEERAGAMADMESHIESDLAPALADEEPVALDATGAALDSLAEAALRPVIEDAPAPEPPTTTESHAGDEETFEDAGFDGTDELETRGTVFAHPPTTGDPAANLPKEPDLDEFDIAYEVERLLRSRRWDKREEPFHGFDSPPGKF